MKVLKIDHINIVVSELEDAKRFFGLLGFEVRFEKELIGDWIDRVTGLKDVHALFASLALPDTETVVELLQYLRPPALRGDVCATPHAVGLRHLAFRVQNIEAWRQRLIEHGVAMLSEVQRPQAVGGKYAGKQLCYFLGPDNILLELMEYDA